MLTRTAEVDEASLLVGHDHLPAATILRAGDQKRYLAACRQSPYRALRLGGSF